MGIRVVASKSMARSLRILSSNPNTFGIGDYERCIEIDGNLYGHILDPRTGWPVSSQVYGTLANPLSCSHA